MRQVYYHQKLFQTILQKQYLLKRYDEKCFKSVNCYSYATCYIYVKSSHTISFFSNPIERKNWREDSLVVLGYVQRTQTSLRRLQDVLKRSQRLMTKQDVVRTSGKRRRIYDVLKTSDLRRLEDVQFTTSWRRLIYDVL